MSLREHYLEHFGGTLSVRKTRGLLASHGHSFSEFISETLGVTPGAVIKCPDDIWFSTDSVFDWMGY